MDVLVFSTVRDAERLVKAYLSRPAEEVYFDTETSGREYREDKLATIQLKQGERSSVVFDVRDRGAVVGALAPIFANLLIIGHNLKFDLNWLRQYGIRAKRVFDTQIAEQLIHGRGLGDETRKSNDLPMNLKAVAERRGIAVSKEEREWFYKPAPLHLRPEWDEPLPREQVEYARQDIEVLRPIFQQQLADLKRNKLIEIAKIEFRCLPALVEMEHSGIHINVEGWREFIAEQDTEAKRLEGEVLSEIGGAILNARIREYDAAMAEYTAAREGLALFEAGLKRFWEDEGQPEPWGEFKRQKTAHYRANQHIPARPKLDLKAPNLGSQQQLITGLEALGVAVPTKKNEKGQVVQTTESKSLEPLANQYPVVGLLLKWRKASKFVTSFGDKLIEKRDKRDRIHPEYRQIGADTGRMSCTNPNFQQIPSKGAGKRLRQQVTAPPGYRLLISDFSNIELRILANITQDENIMAAFASGVDLHSDTAKRIFNLPAEWGKSECDNIEWKNGWSYRDVAKMVNFLLIYGGSAFKLAMELGIPKDETERMLAEYFESYPGVSKWMQRTKSRVWDTRSSRTLTGRIRKFPDPGLEPSPQAYVGRYQLYQEARKQWKKRRSLVERQALNSPIQGTSADITKLAIALFHERCDPRVGRLVVVVHDELVVETPERHAGVVAELLADCMKEACDTYLTVSPVPRPKVNISDHWEKD